MKYQVQIRKNATGEVRIADFDLPWNEGSWYWWTEGNMACDCNRENEFLRAGGDPDREDEYDQLGNEISPCGDTRYSVIRIYAEDGTLLGPFNRHTYAGIELDSIPIWRDYVEPVKDGEDLREKLMEAWRKALG